MLPLPQRGASVCLQRPRGTGTSSSRFLLIAGRRFSRPIHATRGPTMTTWWPRCWRVAIRTRWGISRATTRIWRIHVVGRIRVNPWYGPRRPVKRAVSNDRVGPGFAHGPNHLNGHFIRPGRTSEPLLDWQRTYEMDI